MLDRSRAKEQDLAVATRRARVAIDGSLQRAEEVVERVLVAAQALTEAATEATLAGRLSGVDAPPVNLLEGAVLNEMEEAQRCFDDAREATPLVPRLVPEPATRHVLGSRKSASKGKPEAADKPAAPPVT